VTVTQRVEDELQLASGPGHGTDVAATAVGDPLPEHPPTLPAGTFLTDSIAAQRTSREPCLDHFDPQARTQVESFASLDSRTTSSGSNTT
jgi:hypothetical protein